MRYYLTIDLPGEEALYKAGTSERKVEMDELNWDASSINVSRFWNSSYIGINRANAVLDRVPAVDMNENMKSRILGEARFIRALMFFNLVRAFGDVPIREKETTDLNISWQREPSAEVYELIISDLELAKAALPENYPASEAGRATKGAAQALLAKVYITMAGEPLNDESKWALAVTELEAIINSGTYALFENYGDIFDVSLQNGMEHIFSIQFKKGGFNEGSLYNTFWSPRGNGGLTPLSGLEDIMAVPEFYETFRDDDIRKEITFLTQYVNPSTGDTVRYPSSALSVPACWKYFDPNGTGWRDNDNNWLLLRYADVLLMYAEALNEVNNGPTEQAYEAINLVRERAGLEGLSGMDEQTFRQAVYQERSWELSYEGHRWYDLVRQGRFVEVMSAYGFDPDPRYTLFPIPIDQIILNPDIRQNNGY